MGTFILFLWPQTLTAERSVHKALTCGILSLNEAVFYSTQLRMRALFSYAINRPILGSY